MPKNIHAVELGRLGGRIAGSPAALPRLQPVAETQSSLESEKRARRREYIKNWYAKNPEKKQAYYLSYWEKHRDEVMAKRHTPEGKAKISESNRKQRLKNLDEKREYMKAWYLAHKHDPAYRENCRKNTRTYYHRHIEKEKQRAKRYVENNREKVLARFRRLRRTDLNFAIKDRLRATMSRALRRQWARKSLRTMDLVGCSVEDLKLHLEKQFKDGMTWENRSLWHVDHIRPLSSFELKYPEQQKLAFHYTNLQPLWSHENHAKSDKYEEASDLRMGLEV